MKQDDQSTWTFFCISNIDVLLIYTAWRKTFSRLNLVRLEHDGTILLERNIVPLEKLTEFLVWQHTSTIQSHRKGARGQYYNNNRYYAGVVFKDYTHITEDCPLCTATAASKLPKRTKYSAAVQVQYPLKLFTMQPDINVLYAYIRSHEDRRCCMWI